MQYSPKKLFDKVMSPIKWIGYRTASAIVTAGIIMTISTSDAGNNIMHHYPIQENFATADELYAFCNKTVTLNDVVHKNEEITIRDELENGEMIDVITLRNNVSQNNGTFDLGVSGRYGYKIEQDSTKKNRMIITPSKGGNAYPRKFAIDLLTVQDGRTVMHYGPKICIGDYEYNESVPVNEEFLLFGIPFRYVGEIELSGTLKNEFFPNTDELKRQNLGEATPIDPELLEILKEGQLEQPTLPQFPGRLAPFN